ncbi:MAG: hypothetical protein FJ306_13585 [Planctomycetes bacterium]|nr:hypothetical protein [Planctomycetota bacterium]
MTRYDPFSYGQLPLGGKGPAPSSPDDILFDPSASPQQAGSPAMARGKAPVNPWEAAGNDGFAELLSPGAGQSAAQVDANAMSFGAEVLGEVKAAAPAPARAPQQRILETKAKLKSATHAATAGGKASARDAQGAQKQKQPKQKQPLPHRELEPMPLPLRRRSIVLSFVGTLTVAGGGLAAAHWLYFVQHNPILGGIVAAASVVAGAITWLLLRR